MRYIIRESKCRGTWRYWDNGYKEWSVYQRRATVYNVKSMALIAAIKHDGRVVRLLNHEESKLKAQAEVLRKAAQERRDSIVAGTHSIVARILLEEAESDERRADDLWPAPKGKRARGGK